MKSRIFLCTILAGIVANAQTTEFADSTYVELQGAEIVQKLPLTSEKITKQKLESKNLGQDIPTLLQNATSVVTTSDAGMGIGYSSIRIRGIAQEQININYNGVPLNDGESQSVFWVNMPNLIGTSNSVLIQRGVGTSTSGTGTFGAIIQIDGSQPSRKAFLESANSWGSFATQKYSLQTGTGEILNGKLRIDINASLIKSDGYIDRASSNLYSYGLNAKYDVSEKTSLRYWTFFGKEKTYQAWNGIDAETLKNNRRFNPSGAIYNDDWTKIIGFYDNETDNYQQHHNHLIWEQKLGNNWKSETTLYYTKGKGYYENYKQNADLVEYNFFETEIETSDLVRQKWLNNSFYGLNFNLENQRLGDVKLFTGFSINQFDNQHYGKVNWVKDFSTQSINHEFYRNKALKTDFSAYGKVLYPINQFELFGDVQFRHVNYKTKLAPGGENIHESFYELNDEFNFFNPKVGVNFYSNSKDQFYFYYGIAHREPNRSDYMDNSTKPKAETLHDFELGYKKTGRLNFSANAFYMYYIDQLVATGKLNDVGAPIRENSGKSYRTGIELSGTYQIIPQKFNLFGNLTYAIHKNIDYHQEVYDENWNVSVVNYGDTPISFSPNWIGSLGIEVKPNQNISLSLTNKYVGEQYLTNTKLSDGKLDRYFLTDFLIQYTPKWFHLKQLDFTIMVNNLFDVTYESNGFYYEGAYYYPQAGINILGGVRFSL